MPSGRKLLVPTTPSTYVDQATGVDGQALSARNLEFNVAAGIGWHRRRPLFQGIETGQTNVTSSTWTPLPLSEIIDTDGRHNDSSNTSRIYGSVTSTDPDWYLCIGYVPWVSSVATLDHIAGLRISGGGTIYEGMKIPGNAAHFHDCLVVDLLQLANTDYLELMAWQNTGAGLNTANTGKTPSLSTRLVCAGSGTTVALPAAPRTWAGTDLLTADATGGAKVPLNTEIRDRLRFMHYRPICRATSVGTSQTLASGAGTWGSIQLSGTDTVDNYAMHDPASNNTRVTCQRAGLYFVYGLAGVAEAASGNTGYRAVRLKQTLAAGGTQIYSGASSVPATTTTAGTALPAVALIRMAVNDYVELQMDQTQGSALTVKGGAGDCSRLIAVWMSY